MNDELLLILNSIKNALGDRGDKTSTDKLCDAVHDVDLERCHYIDCIDCIVGYKDSTQYAHQIIQTWKIL